MSAAPDGNHEAAHEQRAHDPPEQHSVLVDGGDAEGPEDHRDDEDVVDCERLLDEEAGQVLDRRGEPVVVDRDSILRSRRGHRIGARAEPEPSTLVAEVDETGEGHAERDPHRGPAERLAHLHHVCGSVEDAQVECEQQQDERDEADVEEFHAADLGGPACIGPARGRVDSLVSLRNVDFLEPVTTLWRARSPSLP
jgi:hypothetical protein